MSTDKKVPCFLLPAASFGRLVSQLLERCGLCLLAEDKLRTMLQCALALTTQTTTQPLSLHCSDQLLNGCCCISFYPLRHCVPFVGLQVDYWVVLRSARVYSGSSDANPRGHAQPSTSHSRERCYIVFFGDRWLLFAYLMCILLTTCRWYPVAIAL